MGAAEHQNADSRQLLQIIVHFIEAPSWSDAKRLTNEHPELLSDQADALLARLVAAQSGESARTAVIESRALLRRCRTEGVEAAFAAVLGPPTDVDPSLDVPGEFLADMRELQALRDSMQRDRSLQRAYLARLESTLQRLPQGQAPTLRAVLLNEQGIVYRGLATGNREDNLARAIAAYEEALRLIRPEAAPGRYATIESNLGNAYSDLATGDRASNLARAIAAYERALSFRSAATPVEYARTQYCLGLAYRNLPNGDRGQNIARAIACFREALRFCTPESDSPIDYARIQNDLGSAYSDSPLGDRAANLRQAIACYEHALTATAPEADPLEYAMTQNSLGKAYAQLPTGDRAAQLAKSLACYAEALRYISAEVHPVEYAATQSNMGIAYRNLPTGDRAANLTRAIACQEQALRFWTPESAPREYAMTQHNLGNAYIQLPTGDRVANVTKAIACYLQALRFRTPQADALQYARTNTALGAAYLELPNGDRATNLAKAVAYLDEALRCLTPDVAPHEYALAQNNLGIVYQELTTGDRAANLARAITCYHEALRFRTLDAAPLDYAMTQFNLGGVYALLPTGDRASNLRMAITCYGRALRVYTPEAAPLEYAMIQVSMGVALVQLPTSDKAANVAEAITCYERALHYFNRETAPLNYTMTQQNLGNAYAMLPTGDRATNLATAIACYERALSLRTPEAAPFGFANSQHGLGNAYATIPTGDRSTNLAKAIACYEQALRFRTLDAAPRDHALTQTSLGRLHFAERHWEAASSAFAGALAAIDALYLASATEVARQAWLAAAPDVVSSAAYCLSRLGRFSEAVERVEAGRTRAISEALTRDSAALGEATPADRAAFVAARERIRILEAEGRGAEPDPAGIPVVHDSSQLVRLIGRFVEAATGSPQRSFTAISEDLRSARREIAEVAARIRLYVPDFLPVTAAFAAIADAAASDQPLVYVLTTRRGSLALIVPPGATALSPEHVVWLDGFGLGDFDRLMLHGDSEGHIQGGYVEGQVTGDPALLMAALDRSLPILERQLVSAITQRLGALGFHRATFIPTGRLSLLPLHAAALDTLTVSYAPSAFALGVARKSAKERSHKLGVLFGVGNPLPHPNPLVFAQAEVEVIASMFAPESRRLLSGHEATRERALQQLPGATNLHFACHGAFDVAEPLDSALYFAGEQPLTLRDLLRGDLDLSAAGLAVLSACQTGITDFKKVPDEAVGLAAGFLQAGVPAVLSSLWPVADISTALLMQSFYQYHLQRRLDAASALRHAQQWLRTATASEMDLIQWYQKLFEASARRDVVLLDAIRYYRANPAVAPFAHPYYWAPFIVSGTTTA